MKGKIKKNSYECRSLFKNVGTDRDHIADSFLKRWCEYIMLQESKKSVAI